MEYLAYKTNDGKGYFIVQSQQKHMFNGLNPIHKLECVTTSKPLTNPEKLDIDEVVSDINGQKLEIIEFRNCVNLT